MSVSNGIVAQIKDYIAHNFYSLINSGIFGRSGEVTASKDRSTGIGGYAGLFGQRDERIIQIVLNKMETETEGSSLLMANFLGWLFPKSDDPVSSTVIWYMRNEFTTFISKMGSTSGEKTGEIKTVTKTDGSDTVTTTTKDIREEGEDNGLATFRRLYEIINTNLSNGLTQTKAFEKAREYMIDSGIPCIKDGWLDKSGNLSQRFKDSYSGVILKSKDLSKKIAEKMEAGLEERKKNKGRWQKICEKWL